MRPPSVQTAVCTALCNPYATLGNAHAIHQGGAENNDRRQPCTTSATPRTNKACANSRNQACGTKFKQLHAAACTKDSTGTAFAKAKGAIPCCGLHHGIAAPWNVRAALRPTARTHKGNCHGAEPASSFGHAECAS